jgi:molecular chaperone GrpE
MIFRKTKEKFSITIKNYLNSQKNKKFSFLTQKQEFSLTFKNDMNAIGNKRLNTLLEKNKKFFFSSKAEKAETKENSEDKENKIEVKEDKTSDSDNETINNDPTMKAKINNLLDLYHDQQFKINQIQKKYSELKEAYITKKSEFESIKNRSEKEVQNSKEYAISKFAKEIFDVSDNFLRAFDSIKAVDLNSLPKEEKAKVISDFSEGILIINIKGLSMTYNSFKNTIQKNGINEINTLNSVYDPDRHIVVSNYEDKEKVSYKILNLFNFSQKVNTVGKIDSVGYIYKDKHVLRKAKVHIVRNLHKKETVDHEKKEKTESKDKEKNESKEQDQKEEKKDENKNDEKK